MALRPYKRPYGAPPSPVVGPLRDPVFSPLGGGGGGGAPLPALSYVTGFTGANYVNGTGLAGADSYTFWVAFIHRASSVGGVIAGKLSTAGTTPTTSGWSFAKTNVGAVTFNIRDGVGVKTAPGFSLAAGDVGDVVFLHGVIDVPNNIVRLYKQGTEVGSGTATSGSLVTSANPMGLASRNGGSSSCGADLDIVAFGGIDVVMSGAEIAAHYAAAVAAQKIDVPAVAGTARNWSAEDYAASWPDEVAAATLATTGSLSTGTVNPPVWA